MKTKKCGCETGSAGNSISEDDSRRSNDSAEHLLIHFHGLISALLPAVKGNLHGHRHSGIDKSCLASFVSLYHCGFLTN
jgi:hypothetical protein